MTVNISKHLLGIACIIAGALIPLILCMLTLLPTGFDPRGAAKLIQPTFPIWLKSFLSNSSMVFQPLSNYGPFLRVPSYNNSMICHFAVRCRKHHGGT